MKFGTCLILGDNIEITEKRLKILCDNGFKYCQPQSWEPWLWTDEYAAQLDALFKKYDVTPTSFWCGWEGPKYWNFYDGPLTLGLVPPEYRAVRVKNLCDGADFAKKMGITDVVTHMGFIPENPYDANFAPFCAAVRHVAEHCKKNDQGLLFETGQETPVTMLRTFEQVGTDNLGINLDVANLMCYGKANPADAVCIFGKYVRNMHAKDTLFPANGHDLGKETPIGKGVVPFRAVFERLHEIGYDANITIEREIEGDQQIIDIMESRAFLEGLLRDIYGNDLEII